MIPVVGSPTSPNGCNAARPDLQQPKTDLTPFIIAKTNNLDVKLGISGRRSGLIVVAP